LREFPDGIPVKHRYGQSTPGRIKAMKRSFLLGCLAAAAFTATLAANRAEAASIQVAPLAVATDTSGTATPVHYRGRAYGPGFGIYLGAPSYGPRCWWSHRYHRRVCSYY
jgi:hypothetical protein